MCFISTTFSNIYGSCLGEGDYWLIMFNLFSLQGSSFRIPLDGLLPELDISVPQTVNFGMCAVADVVQLTFELENRWCDVYSSHWFFIFLLHFPVVYFFSQLINQGGLLKKGVGRGRV